MIESVARVHTHAVRISNVLPYLAVAALSLACKPPLEANDDDAESETGEETATGDTGDTGEPSDTGGTTGTGGTDENACAGPEDCELDEWCNFPDDLCGYDQLGQCWARPEECDGSDILVCGCDDNTHMKGCASADGTDIRKGTSACEMPEGYHVCGGVFCPSDSHYCQRVMLDGENPGPDLFFCVALPEACVGTEDCACLAEETCGDYCEFVDGHFTTTCPGG